MHRKYFVTHYMFDDETTARHRSKPLMLETVRKMWKHQMHQSSDRQTHTLRLSGALRGSQGLSGALRGSQKLSGALRGSQKLSGALRGSQRLSEALRGSQMLSDALRSSQRLSDALRCWK